MKIAVLVFCLVLFGCGPEPPKCVSDMRHTGVVTIVDISIGFCQWAEKSGTNVCDRTITYKTDRGQFVNLGLARSGQWPPVWKGARGDIWFWLTKDLDCKDYGGAVITEFDESK